MRPEEVERGEDFFGRRPALEFVISAASSMSRRPGRETERRFINTKERTFAIFRVVGGRFVKMLVYWVK